MHDLNSNLISYILFMQPSSLFSDFTYSMYPRIVLCKKSDLCTLMLKCFVLIKMHTVFLLACFEIFASSIFVLESAADFHSSNIV